MNTPFYIPGHTPGFWNLLTPGQQTGEMERWEGVPGQPMATVNVAPPQAAPPAPAQPQPQAQVPTQPQAQAQPMQAPPDPARVSGWEATLRRMGEPENFGPLQTFLSAMVIPLRPGETMGARMAHAGMLMNMHRQMVLENARRQPLEQRKMEAEVAQAEAAAEETKGRVDFNAKTLNSSVAKAEQDYKNAVAEGDQKKVETAQKQLALEYDKLYEPREREQRLSLLRAQTEQAYRYAAAAGSGGGTKQEEALDKAVAVVDAYKNMYEQAKNDPIAPFDITQYPNQTEAFKGWLATLTPAQQVEYNKAAQAYQRAYKQMPMLSGKLPASGGKGTNKVMTLKEVEERIAKNKQATPPASDKPAGSK